ncbi:MAG: Mur ligase family protein [bacterium]|nr:Mur ligase family protein [bacterium]
MRLEELKTKSILILGFGREGRDTFLFLRKLFPNKTLGIADREYCEIHYRNTKTYFGKDYLEATKAYDVVIKSPGIPYKIMPRETLKKIITQTDIFFSNCPGTIIGITGTKGKSTTTSLIYRVLKEGGLKTHLIGNIGKPVLSFLFSGKPNDVYAYELSSHQLFNLEKSPHIAVFLNIYPEHLDYYRSFDEYAKAKANITLHQKENDYLIFNSQDRLVNKFSQKSKAEKIPITGKYYELDRNAARAVGKIFRIPSRTVLKAIKEFKGLPHRLELVGMFKGITFYNDALSTIPETAIAAIDILGDKLETIFLGGYDRGLEFKSLAERVLKSKIRSVILFPTTGGKIWEEIEKRQRQKKIQGFFADNMKDAVKLAYRHTRKGKIAVLSCASTSFSLFHDYEEKGNLFKKYVKIYGKKT